MIKALLVFLLFALIASSHAELVVSEEEVVNEPLIVYGTPVKAETGNANDYLDKLLENVGPFIKEKRLDPLALPNVQNGFEKKVGLIRIRGGFQVTRNYLRGLRTLHRSGDSTLMFDGDVIKIKASLGIDNLQVGGNAMAYWGAIRKPFSVSGSVEYLSATVALEMPLSEGGKPQATHFQIDKIGKIQLNVQDLGALNWVINGLGSMVLNMLKGIFKNKLSAPLLKLINSSLDKFPILGS